MSALILPFPAADAIDEAVSIELHRMFRDSLDLNPMGTAPDEGSTFIAITLAGKRVVVERMDEWFVGQSGDYLPQDLLGWLSGSEEQRLVVPAIPERGVGEAIPLTERQEAAEYEAEVERQQAQYEEAGE